MQAVRFTGVVKDGKFIPDDPQRFAALLAHLGGKRVRLAIGRPTKIRSLASNSYLWSGVYGTIAEATGNDPDDVHEGLKQWAFEEGVLGKDIQIGEMLKRFPTTRVDQDVFTRYVSWVRQKAEHGLILGTKEHPVTLHIPEPDEM